jgi:pimeloyl-ACP methyl ester carboxylesterase
MGSKEFALTVLLILAAVIPSALAQTGAPASRWAKLDGNKVRYYSIGNEKAESAIVLIHGWACSADFWKESFYAFPGKRVIAIDLPGHGQSDKPQLDYSINHFARSVDAVMKHAGVKKAVLVGHSMGTPIARQFYRLHPNRTLAIVIVDGPLRELAPKAEMEKFLAPMRANYTEASAKFVDGMLKTITDRSLAKSIRDRMLATPKHVTLSALDGMTEPKVWEKDKIDVPVLAVMAPLAANWPPGIKEAYTALAPNMEFHEWADVSHFLMMERPREFNDQVTNFISRNKLL